MNRWLLVLITLILGITCLTTVAMSSGPKDVVMCFLSGAIFGYCFGSLMPKAHVSNASRLPDVTYIPPSEVMGECYCRKCNPNYPYMIACPDCGNKRCPQGQDHLYMCTKSNDPVQVWTLKSYEEIAETRVRQMGTPP